MKNFYVCAATKKNGTFWGILFFRLLDLLVIELWLKSWTRTRTGFSNSALLELGFFPITRYSTYSKCKYKKCKYNLLQELPNISQNSRFSATQAKILWIRVVIRLDFFSFFLKFMKNPKILVKICKNIEIICKKCQILK